VNLNKRREEPVSKIKSKPKPKVKTRKPVAMPQTIAWGAQEIGKVIDRSEDQTRHLIRAGRIKSARKVGDLWMASVADLNREFRLTPETAA
jgi:hypothetical protein